MEKCSGEREMFVSDSMVVDLVDLATRDATDMDATGVDCYWKFTTTDDRILVLSSENLEQIETFIDVIIFMQLLLYQHASSTANVCY